VAANLEFSWFDKNPYALYLLDVGARKVF